MHLKSLELMGFKSFGRKTVFDFQPGVTAIIGPNGSGKSNICDAIRWVLGEQSARALRGTKMSEVIFAGTPQMRPAAFSQVKLLLDNEDRLLPIDFAEISIGRQLFRSGESNYSFNGGRTLLSDIKEMLMDTGIGKDGYSVIGQGDIDDIIFQRIQSRRSLIEEAAGITKFKHRKNHTLQKLEHTRTNLTRVRDIVTEIEMQLGPLAEQADKTRRYQALSSEIRALEIDLVLFDLSSLYGEHENIESMRKGLIAKITEIQAFLTEITLKKAALRESLGDFEGELKARQTNIREANTRIDEVRGRQATLKEEVRSHSARREAITEEMQTVDHQLLASNQEVSDAGDRLRDEEGMEIAISGGMAEIETNLKKVQAENDDHLKEVSQDKESSFQVAVSMTDKKNRITTCTTQLSQLARQMEKGGLDLTGLQGRIEKLQNDKAKTENEINLMEVELTSTGNALNADRAQFTRVEKELTRSEEEFVAAGDQIKILTSRRNLYEEMKNRGEGGVFRGVREALALKDQGLPGIFGMVGDLLTVQKGYEIAFETALGGSIQDIITRDADTAQKAIAILKERKAGRATFLPIDLIQPPPRVESPRAEGCLGVALDLIQYDAKFYSIMNHLLGRILVFDTIEHGVAFSRKNRNFSRIVTLDGDVVRSSGAMTGGADSGQKSGGILARKREMEEIDEKLKAFEAKEKKLRAFTTNLKTERANLSTVIRSREDLITRRKQSLEFFRQSLKKTIVDLVQCETESTQYQTDREEVTNEHARITAVLNESQAELTKLERQNIDLTDRLKSLSGKEEAIQTRLNGLKSLLNEEKVKLAQIAERKKGLKKEMESAAKRKQTAAERKERAEAEIGRLSSAIVEAEKGLAELQVTSTNLDQEKAELEKALEAAQSRSREASREMESLDHTYSSRAKIEDSTKNKLGELDVKLAEVKTHISNKEDILRAEYHIDLNEIGGTQRKFAKREELTEILSRSRFEREKLEPVNPLAIEDYEKTKERHTFLNTQINDLTDAATSLEQVISEIEKISAERFNATFSQINGAFSDIFQIVFPGGEGHLRLSQADDPLNSNVEIVCRLPGKKLTTIELFSGGEKALISIALLFSILQVKPPAFCVLDEIEASLDEANVRRFCRLLRSFADKTQFLVITHNKETMQAVDVIYGITLEKNTGISRQISIKLEDSEKIQEFTTHRKV
ncbi:MAG: chromosome segregation protein SMC [Candidatus Ozemobacteraceae bacterium]